MKRPENFRGPAGARPWKFSGVAFVYSRTISVFSVVNLRLATQVMLARSTAGERRIRPMAERSYSKPSPAELRSRLGSLEYEVTQHDATEPPFRNRFWDN